MFCQVEDVEAISSLREMLMLNQGISHHPETHQNWIYDASFYSLA
jgi:hypothetical protein